MTRAKRHRVRLFHIFVLAVILITAILGVRAYLLYSYPKGYSEYVEKYSSMYGVDELVIYAIIKTESGYNPKSISGVGATGLMQIMPDTFDWIKEYHIKDDESVTYKSMNDAETNIKYGSCLYSVLYEEFGDINTAMAAYHAGRRQVNEWLGDKDLSKDGKVLDNIPSKITNHYVNKIRQAMEVYTLLYY